MDASNDTTKTKSCSKCGVTYPATLEYFTPVKHHRDGLHSWCKLCKNESNRQWYADNRDQERERSRVWQVANRDKTRETARRFRRINPHANRVKIQRRVAKKRTLTATLTSEQWQECLNWWHGRCAYCGNQRDFWSALHQEHVIPLSNGGTYTMDNIVPSCRHCNTSKQDKPVAEWLNWKFKKQRAEKVLARIARYFEWVAHF